MDRTDTIRASMRDAEQTLALSVTLVVLVVFVFLRNFRAALIPSVAVPVSLITTFGIMHLCGYSLNNVTLMALAIAAGFVVDDAIVVLENTVRHIENGMTPQDAARVGAGEVGFTVVAMTLALVSVFIPMLLMGGYVGMFFREFAVTLSAAILVSLLVSLTTTPMMCARSARASEGAPTQPPVRNGANALCGAAARLRTDPGVDAGPRPADLLIVLRTVVLNVFLYVIVPKGFFPQQDTGQLSGRIRADQSISFAAMRQKLEDFVEIVRADPAVENVVGFTSGGNTGSMYVKLKSLAERKESADKVVARLRGQLAGEPGASLVLNAIQDIRVGGRASRSTFQYTLQADDLAELRFWDPRIRDALAQLPELVDVDTDWQSKGRATVIDVDRDAAARLGVTSTQIDATLNDAFSQRLVSTIFAQLNQYRVVMEAAPDFWQSPDSFNHMHVSVAGRRAGAVFAVRPLHAGRIPRSP